MNLQCRNCVGTGTVIIEGWEPVGGGKRYLPHLDTIEECKDCKGVGEFTKLDEQFKWTLIYTITDMRAEREYKAMQEGTKIIYKNEC